MAFQKLVDSGMSIRDVCGVVGQSDKTVRNVLDINLLPEEVREYINHADVKDGVVYRVTAKFKRDRNVDVIGLLEAKATKSGVGSKGKKGRREVKKAFVDLERFREDLKAKLKTLENPSLIFYFRQFTLNVTR